MILCIFGTHPQPFDRALDWVIDASGEEDVVVQHGATPRREGPARIQWHEILAYHELVELIKAADYIVCHGGVGSLMSVIDLGRRPVAIARRREFGEHVDDHQLQITNELAARGYLIPCADAPELRAALESSRAPLTISTERHGDLCRAAIVAAGGRPLRAVPTRRFRVAAEEIPLDATPLRSAERRSAERRSADRRSAHRRSVDRRSADRRSALSRSALGRSALSTP